MYATVTLSQAKPGTLAEVARIWREQVGAELRQVPGVRAIHALSDPETSEGITVIVWDNEAAVETYLQSGQRSRILAPFADVLAAPPAPPKGYDLIYTSTE